MIKVMRMETEQLIIKFEGENDIYLETLALSLNSTINTLKSISDEVLSENDFCKFKVINIQKGSFEIVIQTIQAIAPQLFAVAPQIESVVSIFKTIWDIRKHLKGELPKKIEQVDDKVKVENNEGAVNVFNSKSVNVYINNPAIEKALAELSKTVSEDSTRNGLSLSYVDSGGEKQDVIIPKNELRLLSRPIDVEKLGSNMVENVMITDVIVHKPDLIGDSKWNLFLNASRIAANIEDRTFLEQVRAGEILFSGKTTMQVTLVSRFKVNQQGQPEPGVKPSYKIIKVHKVEQNGNIIEFD